MSSIKITDLSVARTCAIRLGEYASYFNTLVTELNNFKTMISSNWEGDSQDIQSIISSVEGVVDEFTAGFIPAFTFLSKGISSYIYDVMETSDRLILYDSI